MRMRLIAIASRRSYMTRSVFAALVLTRNWIADPVVYRVDFL